MATVIKACPSSPAPIPIRSSDAKRESLGRRKLAKEVHPICKTFNATLLGDETIKVICSSAENTEPFLYSISCTDTLGMLCHYILEEGDHPVILIENQSGIDRNVSIKWL